MRFHKSAASFDAAQKQFQLAGQGKGRAGRGGVGPLVGEKGVRKSEDKKKPKRKPRGRGRGHCRPIQKKKIQSRKCKRYS